MGPVARMRLRDYQATSLVVLTRSRLAGRLRVFCCRLYCNAVCVTVNAIHVDSNAFCVTIGGMEKRQEKPHARSQSPKDVPFNIRVSEAEKAAFTRAAEIAGIPVSAWVRERLRAAAYVELDNIGEAVPFIASHRSGSVDVANRTTNSD